MQARINAEEGEDARERPCQAFTRLRLSTGQTFGLTLSPRPIKTTTYPKPFLLLYFQLDSLTREVGELKNATNPASAAPTTA